MVNMSFSLQEEHLQKLRGRLNDLKTNKEYQAHLFEIELGRKKKDSLEEALLGVLEQVEQNENEQKEVEAQVKEVEQAFEQAKEKLDSTNLSLDQELSTLEREHRALTEQVDRGLLARYLKLKTLRKGFAIAKGQRRSMFGLSFAAPPTVSR